MTKMAMCFAYKAYHGLTDKSGIPYLYHPIHLAEQMKTEIRVCAALLHDIIEDTTYTFSDLEEMGFSPEIIQVVQILTHQPDDLYMEYIQKIRESKNKDAIAVKLADLRHNSNLSRLNQIDEKAELRFEKYQQAIEILKDH